MKPQPFELAYFGEGKMKSGESLATLKYRAQAYEEWWIHKLTHSPRYPNLRCKFCKA